MMAKPTLFTIGHSNHSFDHFLTLLHQHGITAVADVRSSPFSRYAPHFNKDQFASALQASDIAYIFFGKELGGRPADQGCYSNGKTNYVHLAKTTSFRHAISRLIKGASQYRIALLCSEKDPLDCHRTILVAEALGAEGITIQHIHADGKLESQGEALERLVEMLGLGERNLFSGDGVAGHAMAEKVALEKQAKRIAYKMQATRKSRSQHDKPQDLRPTMEIT